MSNTTITPLVGTVRLTTNLVISSLIRALLIAGSVPGVSQTLFIPVGSVSLLSSNPTLDYDITVISTAIIASGTSSSLSFGSAPTVAAGSLAVSGYSVVLAGGTVTPNSGSGSLSGNSPLVTIPNQTITPDTDSKFILGRSPTVTRGLFPPPSAVLSMSGLSAALAFNIVMTPVGTGVAILNGVPLLSNLSIAPLPGILLMTTLASPGIAPSAAQVLLIGNQVGRGSPSQFIPPSASVSLTGIVSGLSLTVPSPPAANLVLGGTIPSVTMTHIQVPPVASLSINSGSANVVQGTVLTLPNGTLSLGLTVPFVNRNLLTFTSSLQLAGIVPTASISSVLAPQTGNVTVTGIAPVGLPGSSITLNSGTSTLSGSAPSLSSATVIPTAPLQLSSASVALNLTIAPAANALTLASIAPSVNGKLTLPTATGAVTTASINPVLGLGITPPAVPVSLAGVSGVSGLAITPQSGGSVLSSSAPSVAQSGLPLTLTGSVLFAISAPIVGLGFAPAVAVVRAQGIQPIVNSLTTLITSSGAAVLSSDAPSVNQTGVIVPAVAELAVTGITVVFQRTGFVSPSAAALVLDSESPLSQQTTVGFITPPSGAVVMIGQPFYIMRYEPDLYYVVNSRGPAQHIVKSPG